MFVSDAYRKKVWTKHERESAQARALDENREYILPAMFDPTIEVPDLLKTTGYADYLEHSSTIQLGNISFRAIENLRCFSLI